MSCRYRYCAKEKVSTGTANQKEFPSFSFFPRSGTISDPGCHGRLSVSQHGNAWRGRRTPLRHSRCTGVKRGVIASLVFLSSFYLLSGRCACLSLVGLMTCSMFIDNVFKAWKFWISVREATWRTLPGNVIQILEQRLE